MLIKFTANATTGSTTGKLRRKPVLLSSKSFRVVLRQLLVGNVSGYEKHRAVRLRSSYCGRYCHGAPHCEGHALAANALPFGFPA